MLIIPGDSPTPKLQVRRGAAVMLGPTLAGDCRESVRAAGKGWPQADGALLPLDP